MTTKAAAALVLAAGRGTRMQRVDPSAVLNPGQAAAAARGSKAMIPDALGRPFLDHVLSSLADAGIESIGVVVSPDDDSIANHYRAHPPRRSRVAFIAQAQPTGTAHALLAAEEWVDHRSFLSLNADNLYDASLLAEVAALDEPGCAAFDAVALVSASNFPADRVRAFALLEIRPDGLVKRVIEKPDDAARASTGDAARVSMNIWRFDERIFDACRDVPRSVRGEYELPEAVGLAIERGMPLRAVFTDTGVLDLSARGDITTVAVELANRTVNP